MNEQTQVSQSKCVEIFDATVQTEVQSSPTVMSEADALYMLQLDLTLDNECDTEFENKLDFFSLTCTRVSVTLSCF